MLTENLRTAQSGGPAAEVIVEIPEDDVNEGSSQEGADDAATNHHNVHGSPCRHTLKLIQNVMTRWNSTCYVLSRCVQLKLPLCKLMNEVGLEGPSDNDWVTGELLCHFMKTFQTVTDYLQGEKYPTLGSLSRKVTQLLLYLSRPKPPQSWDLNKVWGDLPIAVTCLRDFLLNDLTKRWGTGNVLLGMAAFVDPRHKSLEWLKRHQQHTIQKQLLEEMYAVSGLQMTEIAPGNEDDAQIVKRWRFDDCDFLDEEELDEQDTSEAAAGALQRAAVHWEYDAWLLVPEA